jgi:hypothetical protein
MAKPLPPFPFKSQAVNRSGWFSPIVVGWFRDLYVRVGGLEALSNVELAQLQQEDLEEIEADISSIQSSITSLQATVAGHTSSIAALNSQIEDLKKAPVPE